MKVLVVESPNKVRTIRPLMGNEWHVVATVGHFVDLPDHDLAVDEATLKPQYEIKREDIVRRIKAAARKADAVYIATDPDREGEAIAWHIERYCASKAPMHRISFHSLTKKDIMHAVNHAGVVNMPLVKAQEARRVADRLTGYLVSPAMGRGKTAGRVQTPALRLLVEREREIENFVVRDHFEVVATTDAGWKAKWHFRPFLPKDAEKPYLWLDQSIAAQVAQTRHLIVHEYEKKDDFRAPPPPLTTSGLQQAATTLGFSPEVAMKLAQALFEAGVITYHRTDCRNISEEANAEVRAYLQQHGLPLAESVRTWKSKAGSQEAHEAIRPTNIAVGENDLPAEIDPNARRLYALIRNRVLASQMAPAHFEVARAVLLSKEVRMGGKPAIFVARGEKMLSPGWRGLSKDPLEADDGDEEADNDAGNPLPELAPNDEFPCSCEVKAKKTAPPGRYTESGLLKKLESLGIGRPSTYASIVSGLKKRGHAVLQKKKLVPLPMGFEIIDLLQSSKFDFVAYDYTKHLETQLDLIASSVSLAAAEKVYEECLRDCHRRLKEGLLNMPREPGTGPVTPLDGDGSPCPKCKSPVKTFLVRKEGVNKGKRFLGCSNRDCDHRDMPASEGWEQRKQIPALEGDGTPCPECKSPVRTYQVKAEGENKGKRFLACTDRKCTHRVLPESEGWQVTAPLEGDGDACPKCTSPMKTVQVRKEGENKGKRFLVCSACDHSVMPESEGWAPRVVVDPLPLEGETCPECGHGHRRTVKTTKKGPNQGKRLQLCTLECGWREFPEAEWGPREAVSSD